MLNCGIKQILNENSAKRTPVQLSLICLPYTLNGFNILLMHIKLYHLLAKETSSFLKDLQF